MHDPAHRAFAAAAAFTAFAAFAGVTPTETLRGYEAAARVTQPSYTPSEERGATFFRSTHGGAWSCASCHTGRPLAPGQHARTGKAIAPLSPLANAERFTDSAHVEKWFGRNCNDVLSRACTSQEKADVLAFLLALR
jgi:cytochrome c peroxidase